MKLTVSEYASKFNTSVQSVYQRIKRGTLKSIQENGIKYIVVDKNLGSGEVVKPVELKVQGELKQLAKMVKRLQNKIDAKDLEIKKLTKKLLKCGKSKEGVLLQYISELKQLQLIKQKEPGEDEIIEVKKKKKKRKKK